MVKENAEMEKINELIADPADESGNHPVEPTIPWYQQNINLEDAKMFIKTNIASAARSFIAVGFYLKCVRDKELYKEDGYESIWDFAKEEYGISKSTASRYMTMNDKFSENGNSPIIQKEYQAFDKSKLQEMMYLEDEQLQEVTPEFTVKDIRNLRPPKEIAYFPLPGQMEFEMDFPEIFPDEAPVLAAGTTGPTDQKQTFDMDISDFLPDDECVATSQLPEPGLEEQKPFQRGCITGKSRYGTCSCCGNNGVQCCGQCKDFCNCRCGWLDSPWEGEPEPEPDEEIAGLSAYGTSKIVYPPDSYVTTKGCEGGHSCYCCHRECDIRQEECNCVHAPLGNPFPCEILRQFDVHVLELETNGQCQFVDLGRAYHRAGDGEPVPCCERCEIKCEYACQRSTKQNNSKQTEQVPEMTPAKPEKSEWVNPEEEQVDESYSFAGIPRASDRYVSMLARMFVQDRFRQLVSGLTVIPDEDWVKEQIYMYSLSKHNQIEIGDGVIAYATPGDIEFYREDEDLGICLYPKFANRVRKQLDEYMQNQTAEQKQPDEEEPEQETVIDAEFTEVSPEEEYTPEYFLAEQQRSLDEILKACEGEAPANIPHKLLARYKIVVAALTAMVSSLEQEGQSDELDPVVQPELPILKNNDLRKAWLKDYKAWGLWYRDENIDVNYYKYDFDNGSRLIAEEYLQREPSWGNEKYDRVYYHLVQKNRRKYRSEATYDEKFDHSSTSESEIVEYLKQIQKKGKG